VGPRAVLDAVVKRKFPNNDDDDDDDDNNNNNNTLSLHLSSSTHSMHFRPPNS
jgi:hypothetical protein